MPIPSLTEGGELPPGIYHATINELETLFGVTNQRRRLLMNGLKSALALLRDGGVSKVFIDGSFISNKLEPSDVDGCWSTIGVDPLKLDPRFWDYADLEDLKLKKQSLRQEFGIDFFIAELVEAGSGKHFPDFFQTNRNGEAKGIIEVNL